MEGKFADPGSVVPTGDLAREKRNGVVYFRFRRGRVRAVGNYGSMEAYIRDGLEISDEEVEQLRSELLE